MLQKIFKFDIEKKKKKEQQINKVISEASVIFLIYYNYNYIVFCTY